MSITRYPLLETTPYELLVAQGQVPNVTNVNIYGTQASVDGTYIPIWENATPYVYQTSASTKLLYSSSASDTNVTVLIRGLDANYVPISETIVLTNGTTGVTTVNSYLRITEILIPQTATVNPVGILRLSSADKATTYAQINVGAGRSQMCIYTVPAGYTFYLERVSAYTSAGPNKTTYYRSETRSPTGIIQQVLTTPFVTEYKVDRIVPRPYPEKTDIQFQATSDAVSFVSIQVEGYLIKNP